MCATDQHCPYEHDFDHVAKFRCTVCTEEFQSQPGEYVMTSSGVSVQSGTECPKCGALYVEWLDYARFEAEKETIYEGCAR